MKCPFCGFENIEGEDSCESCGGDLMSIDVQIEPQSELERALMEDPISSVPPPNAIRLKPKTTIYEAAKAMNEKKIGSVLVMEGDKLLGIVTERDILFKAFTSAEQDPTQDTLESIMTKDPESLHETDTLAYALNRMSLGGYRHLPIIQEETVAGLISVQNLLKFMTKRLQD